MPNKALFFDRDGTLNVDVHYLHDPEDFVWVEGAIEAIRWANEHGYLVIVITNQSGIARGYYDEAAGSMSCSTIARKIMPGAGLRQSHCFTYAGTDPSVW